MVIHVSVRNYVTADLCTSLSSELNILACNSSSICLCYAAMQRRRLLHYIQNFFDRRRMFWVLEIFTWILILDILVLIIVFVVGRRSCYFEADSPRLGELLLRGGFFLVELLFRDRFSLFGGLSKFLLVGGELPRLLLIVGGLSRLLLVWLEDYRASCLFGSLCRYFCLLQRHDLIDSSIGTAVDFVAG